MKVDGLKVAWDLSRIFKADSKSIYLAITNEYQV
jgi:hypothetical protein